MKEIKLPMRVFSVVGVSRSGKTTVVEELTKELTKRGYNVGTVKSIGCGRGCEAHTSGRCDGTNHHPKYGFTIDSTGKNSFRHKDAGSKQVTTWAKSETAILRPYQMELFEIIDNYELDFLIVEGGRRYPLPKITTGSDIENTNKRMTDMTFAISGKIADEESEIKNIKTFKTFEEIEKLADLVEEKVFPTIGFKDVLGCNMCGSNCKTLSFKILNGEKSYLDCKRQYPEIESNSQDEELIEKMKNQIVKIKTGNIPEKIKIEF